MARAAGRPGLPGPSAPGVPISKRHGVSGTSNGMGRISGYETNSALKGRSGIVHMEKMRRTDPWVSAVDRAFRETLLSATFLWEPCDCTWCVNTQAGQRFSRRLSDYANAAFGLGQFAGRGRMKRSFEAVLGEQLHFVPLGYRYGEELYWSDGDLVWLDDIEDREPSAHADWRLTPEGDELMEVVQRPATSLGGRSPEPIPAEQLVVFTFERTGQNFDGTGLLRRCYYWHRVKERVGDSILILCERYALPTPRVRTNFSALVEATKNGTLPWLDAGLIQEWKDELREQAELYVASETGSLADNDIVSLDVFADKIGDIGGLLQVIEHANKEIASAYLAMFMRLGMNETGAKNVGEVHSSLFRRSGINVLDIVTGTLGGRPRAGGGTIGRLCRWNFGTRALEHLPRLRHSGLDVDHLAGALGSISPLITSGALTPDDSLEGKMRMLFGLGSLPEHCRRTPEERGRTMAATYTHRAQELLEPGQDGDDAEGDVA